MQVVLHIDGGFAAMPGLAGPFVVSDQAVAPGERGKLDALVQAALDDRGSCGGPAQNCPDGRTYRLSIERDGGQEELVAGDPAVPPAFSALAQFVRQHGQRLA